MSSVEALGNEHIINGQKIPTTGTTAALKRSQEDPSLESGIPAKRTAMYGGTDSLVQMGGPFMGGQTDTSVELYPVPENTVGLVIGKGGSEIQNIQSQSGCRVQMSPDSDNTGYRQVTLQGMRANIDKAKAMIQDVVMRAQQRQQQNNAVPDMGGRAITIDIPIPPNKCGLIIGKQGETIRQLQEQSGCKMMMIQATQEVTGSAKPLRVTGDPEKIEIARRLVDDLISKEDGGMGGGGGGMMHQPRQGMHGGDSNATARGEVVVPRSSVGMIIGKGGETIKRLAVETGTKIQFKPDDDPNSPERCALIMGTRDQIYRATELITELVNKSNMNSSQQQETFFMHIPAIKTGLVIGKGGETIKQINQESGAHCELSRDPPPNPSEKVFMIRGTPNQIHHAQHIIRIKVGDIAPNTPVPIMAGQVQQQPQIHPGNGGYQKSAQPYGGGQFVAQPQQPQQPAWNSYGSGMPNAAPAIPDSNMYGQNQYYGGAQPTIAPASQPQSHFPIAAAQYQQPAVVNPTPYAQPQAQPQQAQVTPAINPSTGQTDYSAQWAEYYRSVGLLEQAAMVESQMKQNAARAPAATGGVAAPYAQYQSAGIPAQQPAAQQPYAQYQASGFPQTGQFQPGQPQQF